MCKHLQISKADDYRFYTTPICCQLLFLCQPVLKGGGESWVGPCLHVFALEILQLACPFSVRLW